MRTALGAAGLASSSVVSALLDLPAGKPPPSRTEGARRPTAPGRGGALLHRDQTKKVSAPRCLAGAWLDRGQQAPAGASRRQPGAGRRVLF